MGLLGNSMSGTSGSGGGGGSYSGGAITSPILGPDGSAAAPSYSYSSGSSTGNWKGATHGGVAQFTAISGTDQLAVAQGGVFLRGPLVFDPSLASLSTTGDLYLKRYAAKQVSITGDGTGATTNAGWVLGYYGTSGYSALWPSTVAVGANTYALLTDGSGITLNNPHGDGTTGIIGFSFANQGARFSIYGTAGQGPSITAGTATTDVNALSVTQTWNAAGVAFTGILANITNTASAAAAKLMDLQVGGVSQFSVSKGGLGTFASSVVSGANVEAENSSYLYWATRARLASPADGVVAITNNAATVNAVVRSGSLVDGTTKTLTETTATGVLDVTVASGARISGELHVAVEADDGTEFQVRHLRVPFTAINKAGTVTSTLGTPVETVTVSAGTLTATITITNGAGKITLNVDATSSLTQTTLRALSKIVSPHQLTITAL